MFRCEAQKLEPSEVNNDSIGRERVAIAQGRSICKHAFQWVQFGLVFFHHCVFRFFVLLAGIKNSLRGSIISPPKRKRLLKVNMNLWWVIMWWPMVTYDDQSCFKCLFTSFGIQIKLFYTQKTNFWAFRNLLFGVYSFTKCSADFVTNIENAGRISFNKKSMFRLYLMEQS